MAGIIAPHHGYWFEFDAEEENSVTCDCGQPMVMSDHVAEELAKAGYGNVQEALLAAANEMPIETLLGADKASVWLRTRAQQVRP